MTTFSTDNALLLLKKRILFWVWPRKTLGAVKGFKHTDITIAIILRPVINRKVQSKMR